MVETSSLDAQKILQIKEEIKKVFIGKETTINTLLIGFFGGLSVLIEDIPGVGKTTLAKSLAAATGMDFGRIQFTPDLLPGDIIGMTVWSQEKRDFIFKPGAVMHQFILADEINRAAARTQSALLETMQESAVTVDGNTYPLPQPFFVVATQNPTHFMGTFQLPEAQLDRFGISFTIGYPNSSQEILILDSFSQYDTFAAIEAVITPQDIMRLRGNVEKVYVDNKIKVYLTEIAAKTRESGHIKIGMSPRATLHLMIASKSMAFLSGREYVLPEDVVSVASSVLMHRLLLSPEARMENMSTKEVVAGILQSIPLPTGLT